MPGDAALRNVRARHPPQGQHGEHQRGDDGQSGGNEGCPPIEMDVGEPGQVRRT
jgi:hypothetical protein